MSRRLQHAAPQEVIRLGGRGRAAAGTGRARRGGGQGSEEEGRRQNLISPVRRCEVAHPPGGVADEEGPAEVRAHAAVEAPGDEAPAGLVAQMRRKKPFACSSCARRSDAKSTAQHNEGVVCRSWSAGARGRQIEAAGASATPTTAGRRRTTSRARACGSHRSTARAPPQLAPPRTPEGSRSSP